MAAWSPEQIESFMKDCDLFRNLPPDLVADLATRAFQQVLPAEETVFSRGDEGNSLYLIGAGQVRVTLSGPEGEEDISTLGPGDFFGEIGMLTQSKRTAGIVTLAEVTLLNFAAEDILPIAEAHPEFKALIGRTGAQRSRESMKRLLGD